MAIKPQTIDVAANMSSFAIASALALGANLIVLYFWGQEGMGVFMQTFAIYILATQIGARGTQNATLTFLGRWHHKQRYSGNIILAALALTLVSSVVISVLVWVLAGVGADILQSGPVENSLRSFVPAIIFGSLIKITMAAINGASMLRRYAFLQAFRAVAIFLAVVSAGFGGADIEVLGLYFGAAEALSFTLGLGLLAKVFRRTTTRKIRRWFGAVSLFGIKTLPYGVLAELNTKIDVLVLGFFASDAIVGVYSFAALLAEGFANLIVVFRVVFSPKLARLLTQRRLDEVRIMFLNWRLKLYGGGGGLAIFAALFLWLVLPFVPINVPSDLVVVYFGVIVAGVIVAAAHMPFNTVLMLGGKPGLHSLYFLSILSMNAVGNIILTPIMGALGTAIATGVSYALSVALLVYLARRYISVKLY